MQVQPECAPARDISVASIIRPSSTIERVDLHGFFTARLLRNGEIVWEDEFANLVTNVGKADALDKYLAGSAYTATFYLGLVDGGSAPTFNAADTMGSHAGWTENQNYSSATRPAPTWNAASGSGGGSGAAGSGSKATTATAFSINAATQTIAGCFLTTVNTKGGTTGTLYSAGAFTGGNRACTSGDTLSVTYTAAN